MNENLEEAASLYVLDRLDAHERAVFGARLLREPELAAFVRELELTLDHTLRALPQRQPRAGLLNEIEGKLFSSPAAATPPPPPVPVSRVHWVNFARWGIAAAIALSLTTLAIQSLRQSPVQPVVVFVGFDANRNTFAELPLQKPTKDADARFIQLASLAEDYWAEPGTLPVKREAAPGGSRGYALFDPSSNQGFVAIEQLPAIGANQRYHLWIVDSASGKVHDAGSLPLGETNRGLYSFSLGRSEGSKSERPNFFVTIEETDSPSKSAQPHGKVVLGDRGI